jgi:hypothetical protein
MHRRKDEIQALIKGGSDPTMVRFQAERWVSEYEGLQSFDRLFYHGKGVPAVEDVRSAVALGVTQVPSFRLVSPAGRVHALGGFGPGVDLVAWVESAVAWERASEPQLPGVGRGR